MFKKMDKIQEFFIKNPEKEIHVRELAKKTGYSPTTVSKYLDELRKESILSKRIRYNHSFYHANFESKRYKTLKLYHNLDSLHGSGIIEYIAEEYNFPMAIVLFGSYCKAEDTEKSDIDILVITASKKEVDLSNFENILKKPVQIFRHSSSELKKMRNDNPELLNNFLNGITLYGFWEVF